MLQIKVTCGMHLFFYLVPVLLFIVGCSKTMPPKWWPVSGSKVKHIQWCAQVADTSHILTTINGIWNLPSPPPNALNGNNEISQTSYFASMGHSTIMGQIDQVAGHHKGKIMQEYYRFDEGNVLLAGVKSADSARTYTIYDPPVMLVPENIFELDSTYTCESRPRYQNSLTGMQSEGPQIYIEIERIETGRVLYQGKLLEAVLCKITMSKDQEINFQDSKLTLPKTVMVSNHLLMARGVGTLLEWGIRHTNGVQKTTDRRNGNEKHQSAPEAKLEITLHEHISN